MYAPVRVHVKKITDSVVNSYLARGFAERHMKFALRAMLQSTFKKELKGRWFLPIFIGVESLRINGFTSDQSDGLHVTGRRCKT